MCTIWRELVYLTLFLLHFLKDFIYLFLERGEGEEKERERDISVRERERHGSVFHKPQLGAKPTTQAYALTGNQTGNFLLCRMTPNQLSHTSQSSKSLSLHKQRSMGTSSRASSIFSISVTQRIFYSFNTYLLSSSVLRYCSRCCNTEQTD